MESENVVEGQSGHAGTSYVKDRHDEPPMPVEPPPTSDRYKNVPPNFRPGAPGTANGNFRPDYPA